MTQRISCSRCGSDQVLPDGEVRRDTGIARGIEVRVKSDPAKALLTTTGNAALHARVCVECGHVELYVSDLAVLRGIHRERARRGSQA